MGQSKEASDSAYIGGATEVAPQIPRVTWPGAVSRWRRDNLLAVSSRCGGRRSGGGSTFVAAAADGSVTAAANGSGSTPPTRP
jgi:hypothetical protein